MNAQGAAPEGFFAGTSGSGGMDGNGPQSIPSPGLRPALRRQP